MAGKDQEFHGEIKTSYMDSTPWWRQERKAPDGTPNVLFIILDDLGYSQLGCYGSPIETPCIDSIAADGLRYNNFHVNAMCSPTRASLLTGCNSHSVGMGYLANFDLGFPSLTGDIHPKYGYLSETLIENGYSTFAVGKWHLCNQKDMNGAGPFDQWPLGRGFEKFYGFLNAATSQYYPSLVCDNHFIDPPKSPEEGYHISADLVDRAIEYIGDQKSCYSEKPFFCYLSFGAMHAPHHAPREYIDRYRGKFDEGWDIYRERVFARQKELGIIPDNAVLTGHDYLTPPWNSLTEKQKKVFARFMEVFAGFLTYTDEQIGRLINYLKKIKQYDNTLIILLSDNGASAEGGPEGCFNEAYHLSSMKWANIVSDEELELLGSPQAHNHYPRGWAWAGNTPLKMYKTWVYAGGVKVPLIITYPDRIKDKGGIRSQYHHIVDIYQTVLDVCGIEQPESIKRVKQAEKHGVSMKYTFDNPQAPRQRHIQYYEMLGNRGIWADGWKAVADHVISDSFEKDKWELYNNDEDFSEAHDLSDVYPEKLRELIDLWWHEAGKYKVLPLAESHLKQMDGFNSKKMYRYAPAKPRTHYVYYPEFVTGPGPRLTQASYTAKAYVTYKSGDEGVLYAAGDITGGYALYVQDRRLKFHYNWLSYKHFHIDSDVELPEGEVILGFDFTLNRPNAGVGRLLINGKASGTISIESESLFTGSPFSIGKFPFVSITGDMKEKKQYVYTNHIDRVEFDIERRSDDLVRKIELEQALKNE